MDLWTALRVVVRHWLVLLLGVVLTGALVVGLYLTLQRQYSSTGTVIVLQPSVTANPLTALNSSNQLAASVAVTLADPGTSGPAVRDRGGAAAYTLVADPNLPTITITTTSTNPDAAVHTVGVVAGVMNDVLLQRQRSLFAPPSTWLHVVPLTAPSPATNTGGKNKVLALAAVLGLLVAISFTFLAEAFSALRRRDRGLATPNNAPTPHSDTSDSGAPSPGSRSLRGSPSKSVRRARGGSVGERSDKDQMTA